MNDETMGSTKRSMTQVVILASLLAAAGCGGGGGSPPDGGGGQDGGGDAGVRGDAGSMCTIDVRVGNFGTLSPQCFTRCTTSTLEAVNACADVDCVDHALQSDPTPGIPWWANDQMQASLLGCINCYGFQNLHCFSTHGCGSEVDAVSTCERSGPMPDCSAELTALDTCAHSAAHGAAVTACVNDPVMGTRACFP